MLKQAWKAFPLSTNLGGGESLVCTRSGKTILSNWVWYYGIPKRLVHDCDIHFTALFWRASWAVLRTQALFSSAYHPQTDGQTECQHRTVELIIRALIHEGVDDWVEAIPLIELCVSRAVADSTGVSPAAFTYG